MTTTDSILVEVAYAKTEVQIIIPLSLLNPCSAQDAILASGLLNEFPEIDLSVNKIGIFGKECKLVTVLKAKDRVEIYRDLLANPKEQRRARLAKK